jgi:hypothetical protein
MGFGSETDTRQGDAARRNQSETQGNGQLLGPRSARDVSRPWSATMKPGSSTRDQAKAQP